MTNRFVSNAFGWQRHSKLARHTDELYGAVLCVARMARIGVRSGSLNRSVAEWIPLNHAA